MRTFWLLLIIFASFLAHSKELKMLVWSKDLDPIVYLDPQTGIYRGILMDVFNSLPPQHKMTLKFISTNRKRGELDLYEGLADVSIFSKEWMQYPNKLIYSEPIYVQREYLYAIAPIEPATTKQMINHKTICTRRGYIYPKLEPYFTRLHAFRMDSRFELTQFEMLRKKRCDLVMADEYVTGGLLKKMGWEDETYRSTQVVDTANFTIAFHPTLQSEVDIINRHIISLRESGKLEQFILQQQALIGLVKKAQENPEQP
jgi:polar amino acid transport system substrate-binding protein